MWKDSESNIDFLDYDYLVESINSIILDDSLLPATIGLFGDWGSGKSTLINMSKTKLEDNNKRIQCLVFNGWLFESYDDTKTAILEEIIDVLVDNTTLIDKGKIAAEALFSSINKMKLGKSAIKTGMGFALSSISSVPLINKITSILKSNTTGPTKIDDIIDIEKFQKELADNLNYADLRNDVRMFQKNFNELLNSSKIDRLVVYIDELDRCRPDTILETLEAIKLFLFTGKTAFIIGADQRHIEYAVRTKFKEIEGQEIDIGREYLEKLIQYPIIIPRLDSIEAEHYISCLLLQKDLSAEDFAKVISALHKKQLADFEEVSISQILDSLGIEYGDTLSVANQLSMLLGQRLNGNPRQFKRFLNMLEMRMSQAKFKKKELSRSILAKIMIIEYYRPALFSRMAQMSRDGELSNQIEIAEIKNDKVTEDNIFYSCKDDPWLKNWICSSPSLAKEDLRLYFYFSRTSTEERLSLLSAPLSPVARLAFINLITDSETKINNAISQINTMSVSDQEMVFQTFVAHIQGQDIIDSKHFRAMFDIALLSSELKSLLFKLLSQFRKDQIKASFIPFIEDFIQKNNCKDSILEIARNNWDKKIVTSLEKC